MICCCTRWIFRISGPSVISESKHNAPSKHASRWGAFHFHDLDLHFQNDIQNASLMLQKPCTLVELSQKICHKLPSWERVHIAPLLTALLSRWLSFSWWDMDSFLEITWLNFAKGQISEAFQQSFMSAMSHCTSGVTVYTSNFRYM